MTDASAILASLDKFIEEFTRDPELMSDHRVATQNQPVATMNPLINRAIGHSGHSGHPKQETFDGADQERCDAHPSPAENSDSALARKVLFPDGDSGQSGQSFSNQELICSHCENADGHSGKTPSNQELEGSFKGTGEQAGRPDSATPTDTVSDQTIWSDLYQERAAHRQFEGGYLRVEAELLAWREVEWRWHVAHRERMIPAKVCAGCGQLIGADEALDLIDGARVHLTGYRCRIAYEQRWRRAATDALISLGLRPPAIDGDDLP